MLLHMFEIRGYYARGALIVVAESLDQVRELIVDDTNAALRANPGAMPPLDHCLVYSFLPAWVSEDDVVPIHEEHPGDAAPVYETCMVLIGKVDTVETQPRILMNVFHRG